MFDIPQKINDELELDKEKNWIEEHDRLRNQSEFTTLNNENQYKLWSTNCAIRKAFLEIEKEINAKRKKGEKVSTRDVGWSEIARKACCDRNTIKHPIRLHWVTERRERLLKTLEEPVINDSLKIVRTPEEEMKLELEKTQNDLKKSEEETAKWFLKYQDTLDELKVFQEALNRQMKENSIKEEMITNFKKQIKEFMKQM